MYSVRQITSAAAEVWPAYWGEGSVLGCAVHRRVHRKSGLVNNADGRS